MTPELHPSRRSFLTAAPIAALGSLHVAANVFARDQERRPRQPAKSIILIWLAGGPSQLETFDPHPNTAIGGPTRAIKTSAPGIEVAEHLPRLAEQMSSISVVRSMLNRESDHGRATYVGKTGHRPDATLTHPSIGAICCHQTAGQALDIPRHISILPSDPYLPESVFRPYQPGQGGYLGIEHDSFCVGDPAKPIHGLRAPVSWPRHRERISDVDVVEAAFSRGRQPAVGRLEHRALIDRAWRLMNADQLKAFDIKSEPMSLRESYGDTYIGRACLAARRLIESGVRCVEVLFEDWDSHANNFALHKRLTAQLDPAFAALVADLRARDLLDHTAIICGGEFGRTPQINRTDGRDHWTRGFSVALAGGGLRGGLAIGETDPAGGRDIKQPRSYADVYATALKSLGFDPAREVATNIGRPMKLSDGAVINELLV